MFGIRSTVNVWELLVDTLVLFGLWIAIVSCFDCFLYVWVTWFFLVRAGDSTKVATGSADNSLRIWDLYTGKCLNILKTETSTRSLSFSNSGKTVLFTTDKIMGMPPEINVIDVNSNGEKILSVNISDYSKAFCSMWGALDLTFVTGHESGAINQWDVRNPNTPLIETQPHKNQVNDLQYNADQTLIVSASKDHTAKVSILCT